MRSHVVTIDPATSSFAANNPHGFGSERRNSATDSKLSPLEFASGILNMWHLLPCWWTYRLNHLPRSSLHGSGLLNATNAYSSRLSDRSSFAATEATSPGLSETHTAPGSFSGCGLSRCTTGTFLKWCVHGSCGIPPHSTMHPSGFQKLRIPSMSGTGAALFFQWRLTAAFM